MRAKQLVGSLVLLLGLYARAQAPLPLSQADKQKLLDKMQNEQKVQMPNAKGQATQGSVPAPDGGGSNANPDVIAPVPPKIQPHPKANTAQPGLAKPRTQAMPPGDLR